MPQSSLLRVLAGSFLAGQPALDEITARATAALGRDWRWLRPLVRRYLLAYQNATRPRTREVIRFLRSDPGFQAARRKFGRHIAIANWLTGSPEMQPVAAARTWALPPLCTTGELADWFWLEPEDLDWFAGLKGLPAAGASPKLAHYHYRVLSKRTGGFRLIEAPKPRLKILQRQILTGILDNIPHHPAAHGFVAGRSIRTFAAPHVGRQVILRLDLQDFFPSFRAARIQACFRTMGYPDAVAGVLSGICTNAVPKRILQEPLYNQPHLPQGAPTSPALANLCAYRAGCRLSAFAEAAGAVYTRYADDLAFSGEAAFEKCAERFATHAAVILAEEGLRVNHHKTRIMHPGVRQHLAGLVCNEIPNIPRPDFDRLKATLTNCVRHGIDAQNRDGHPDFRAHLEGRVAFVEMINPSKSNRLRRLLEAIPR